MVDARVFVGKLDRTNEFQLLTPTDEMKTRCVRRLEGDNAWGFASLESVCWQYLRHNILDKYGRTAGCPGCVGIKQHIEECRAVIEQEMVDKGDAI